VEIRSLGYRTDLIFPAFDGEIIDRGNYLVVRTPTNPIFYWGNFLLFEHPPGEGDFAAWRELFAHEIGTPPAVQHQTFGWDTPRDAEGATRPFLEAGFRLNRSIVMTAGRINPPARPAANVDIRPLDTDRAWAAAVENQVICREPEFEEGSYREYVRGQMARYQAMVTAGLGVWFGAFIDRRLVADLGVFHNRELGRYQAVQTHPEYRRRGIAGTMVYVAGRYAMQQFDLPELVIVAEEGSAAGRLYGSVGFRQVEYQMGLEWWL
jgi:GNAT superfamily N-acetyltransferase